MKAIYSLLGIGWLYHQIIHIPERFEFISHLNYLTLVLLGVGFYVVRHMARVCLFGTESSLFSGAFVLKVIFILGLTLGVPMFLGL